MRLGKTQFTREVLTDDVAVEQGNGPATGFDQFGIDDLAQC